MRVVVADLAADASGGVELRSILGGLLVQDAIGWPRRPSSGAPRRRTRSARRDEAAADARRVAALRFAWRVCAHVKSNTVIFTGPDRTLAIGAGQMSRVDAVKVAVMKAAACSARRLGRATASVAARRDAFFPFRDGTRRGTSVARRRQTAVVQPGGSVRDERSIAAADEHGSARWCSPGSARR
jgi:phosphoribosylaminoimidazolecarboxamide formyltransferase / IMP cyclohydrolase